MESFSQSTSLMTTGSGASAEARTTDTSARHANGPRRTRHMARLRWKFRCRNSRGLRTVDTTSRRLLARVFYHDQTTR